MQKYNLNCKDNNQADNVSSHSPRILIFARAFSEFECWRFEAQSRTTPQPESRPTGVLFDQTRPPPPAHRKFNYASDRGPPVFLFGSEWPKSIAKPTSFVRRDRFCSIYLVSESVTAVETERNRTCERWLPGKESSIGFAKRSTRIHLEGFHF